MFVPLGLALMFWLGRRVPVTAVAVLTTLVIELLQINVISGRDASLSDIVANTLGAWIGMELVTRRRALTHPPPPAAAGLALAWSLVVSAILVVTSWGLGPDASELLWIQWTPPRPPHEPFTGRLLSFDVDGIDLPSGYSPVRLGLDEHLGRETWTSTAVIDARGLSPKRSIIARIVDVNSVVLSVDQAGWGLVCDYRTRSAALRVRSPRVLLADGLRPPPSGNPLVRLVCARRGGHLDVQVASDVGSRAYSLALSPSLGWVLLSPFDLVFDDRYVPISMLWLIALFLPAGYWLHRARHRASAGSTGDRVTVRRHDRLLGGSALAAVVLALVVGLDLAPRALAVAPAGWWEWAAGLGGVACGAFLHRLIASR